MTRAAVLTADVMLILLQSAWRWLWSLCRISMAE